MELSLNKKALILSLVTILLLFSFSLVALSADIHIEIDGNTLQSDVVPIIKDARILVPFRIIAEAIDIDVSWDEQTKSINAQKGADKLILNIGSKTAYFNKVPVLLDVAPEIINNRVLIPLRFFSNVFDCEVGWLEASKTAIIKTPSPAMRAVGYYALGDSQSSSWTDLFTTPYPETNMGNTELITDLALGWYSLDENGNLLTKSRTGWQRPEGWETVLRAAKKYNLDTEMVIHMTNEGHIITSLLTNPHSVDQAIKQIVLESANYAGVNLDLEGLGLSEKGNDLKKVQDNFSTFVELLADELHKKGKVLSLSLHPPNSSYRGYDYTALGKQSDYIIIMAYDYGPKPEPNDRVEAAITQALQTVPANKLILGISSPSETAASIVSKIELAKKYRLKGIAIWRLGLISEDKWQALAGNMVINK